MTPLNRAFMKILSAPILSALLLTHSISASADESTVRLTREPGQERTLQTTLSSDVFRQESYEASYEVQVPYQVTESYEIVVPYTEWEEYWDREYQCRNVPGFREECHDQQLCAPGSHGTECRVVRTCQQVPTNEQVCHWENVRRTRQVTHYRTETRYREVTKYRTETRCCVTKVRDVFDHKWVMDVELQFPPEADLNAGESEEFIVQMSGTEQAPNLMVRPVNSIFGYKVVNKTVTAQKAVVTLQVTPRFTQEDLGASSIHRVELLFNEAGHRLLIEDSGIAPRVSTTYRYQIIAILDNSVVEQGALSPQRARTEIPLSGVQMYQDYKVILSVERSGEVIDGKVVRFVKAVALPFERLSIADYARADQFRLIDIRGQSQNAKLVFLDESPQHERVKSVYKVTITRKGGFMWRKTITMASATLYREKLVEQVGVYTLPLTDLGVSNADIKKHLNENSRVTVHIEVIRSSEIFKEKPTVSFSKSDTITID